MVAMLSQIAQLTPLMSCSRESIADIVGKDDYDATLDADLVAWTATGLAAITAVQCASQIIQSRGFQMDNHQVCTAPCR